MHKSNKFLHHNFIAIISDCSTDSLISKESEGVVLLRAILRTAHYHIPELTNSILKY